MSNDVGGTWPLVAALFAVMRGEDSMNSARSVGVAIFVNCSVQMADIERFSLFDGAYDAMLKMAMNFYPTLGTRLQSQFVGSELDRNISSMKTYLLADDFRSACLNLSNADRTALTNKWRNSMWTYMLILDALRMTDVIGAMLQVKNLQ